MNSILTLLQTIAEDLQTHRGEWTRPGFQTLAIYRLGRWTKSLETKVIRAPLYNLARVGHVFCRNFYGIELPFEADVGKRLVLEHQGSIVIHGASVIGDDCTLRQGCTLGIKSVDRLQDAPRLGNRVSVGCGAVILGAVTVDNDCVIGANSVVTKNVPHGVTVVGNNKWLLPASTPLGITYQN